MLDYQRVVMERFSDDMIWGKARTPMFHRSDFHFMSGRQAEGRTHRGFDIGKAGMARCALMYETPSRIVMDDPLDDKTVREAAQRVTTCVEDALIAGMKFGVTVRNP